MPVLLLKLLLTPVLISLASLGGRRWGPAVGGWLVGLPLTSAPVAVILTAEHGAGFAATAALGILGGVASQAVFAVAYARTARSGGRPGVGLCTLAASAGFAASTVLLNAAALPLLGMVAVALGALVLGLSLLAVGPRDETVAAAVRMPSWDLPARVVVATAFVVLVTGIAGAAGPRLAGLITPFPIYAAVLTVFAHRTHGAGAAAATLRGLVLGLFAFVAFFAVLAVLLPRVGWAAFLPALAATAAVQAASLGRVGGTVFDRTMTEQEPYGARMIRESRLEAFDNRTPDRDYTIQFTIPEFTCICPISGFPDFATLFVRYVPGPRCVELKSLKLYVNGFRDRGVFHEDVVNIVLNDLVTLLDPRYCEVVGDFNVRGNIKTVVRARHRDQRWTGEPDPWWRARNEHEGPPPGE